jgi:hypothetical protein
MKIRTNIRAGKIMQNHSTPLCRVACGCRVRTAIRAGKLVLNHSASLRGGVAVQSRVRAGRVILNHALVLARRAASARITAQR